MKRVPALSRILGAEGSLVSKFHLTFPPTLGRAICIIQTPDSNVNLIQKVPNRHTQAMFDPGSSHPGSFPGGSDGKESTAMQETWVQPLGQKDPLEEERITHSSILA